MLEVAFTQRHTLPPLHFPQRKSVTIISTVGNCDTQGRFSAVFITSSTALAGAPCVPPTFTVTPPLLPPHNRPPQSLPNKQNLKPLSGPYDNYNLQDSHVLPGLLHKAYLSSTTGRFSPPPLPPPPPPLSPTPTPSPPPLQSLRSLGQRQARQAVHIQQVTTSTPQNRTQNP